MDFFGVESVDEVGRCTTSYPLAGPACLRCLVCVNKKLANSQLQLSLVLLQHIDTCDSSNPAPHPTTTTTTNMMLVFWS